MYLLAIRATSFFIRLQVFIYTKQDISLLMSISKMSILAKNFTCVVKDLKR